MTRGQHLTRPPLREGTGVARNGLFLVAGQLATTAVSFAVTALLAWHLGAADYGVFFVAMTVVQSAFVLADFGQEYYLVARVARDASRAAVLLGSGLLVRLFATVAIIPLIAGLAAVLEYSDSTRAAMFLAIPFVFLTSIRDGVNVVLRGLERMDLEAALRVVSTLFVAGAIAVAVLRGGKLIDAMVMQILGAGAAVVACWVAVRRIGIASPRPRLSIAMSILFGGAPFFLQAVIINSQAAIDALLLSVLVPQSVIGWHAAASKLVGTLLLPANVLATALYPALVRLQGSSEAGELLTEGLRVTVVLGFLCATGTLLFADFAVGLVYGADAFGSAADNLRILAAYLPLVFLDIVFAVAIMAAGRLPQWILAKLASVVVSVVVSVALIPWSQSALGNGGLGVAAATVVSEVVMFVTALRLVPLDRHHLASRVAKDIGRGVIAAAAMTAAAWALREGDTVLRISASVVVYLASAQLLGAIRRPDVCLLREVVRRRSDR